MADWLDDDDEVAENEPEMVIEVDIAAAAADEQINGQIPLDPPVNNRQNLYSTFSLVIWLIHNMLIHHPLDQVISFWTYLRRLAQNFLIYGPMITLGQTQPVLVDPTFHPHRDQVEDWTGRTTHPSVEFDESMVSTTVHVGLGQNEGVPPTDEVELVQNLVPMSHDETAINHDENEEEPVIHHPNIADVQTILPVLSSAELLHEPIAHETFDQPMVNVNPIVSNEVHEETESDESSEDEEDTQAILDDHASDRHVYSTVANSAVEHNSTNGQLETHAQTYEIPQILVIYAILAGFFNAVSNRLSDSSSGDLSNEVTDPQQLVQPPVNNRRLTIFRPKTPESTTTNEDETSDQIDASATGQS